MMCNYMLLGKVLAKWVLITVNGLCVIVAACTSGFAAVDLKVLQQYGEGQATGTFASDVIIIVASLLVAAVATFGSVGIVKESVKILYLYVGFLIILIVLELLMAVFVSVERYALEFRVTDWIRNDFFQNLTGDDLGQHQKLWDELQITYECCGLNGPEDYQAIKQPISMSCCSRAFRARTAYAQQQLYHTCLVSRNYFSEGCEDEILFTLRSDAEWLTRVAVSCFWFQATGMFIAMWLGNNMKNVTKINRVAVRH